MKPNVLLDHIGCHFVTHRPNNIPIFPKLSVPQLLPDLRKLLPNLLGADRLQQSDYRADRALLTDSTSLLSVRLYGFRVA
jgi:hypothetical protein